MKVYSNNNINNIKAYTSEKKDIKKLSSADSLKKTRDEQHIRGTEAAQTKDEVVFSESALEFARFKELLSALPEERKDLVDSLAARIQEGNYNVETEKVVDKLIEESIMTN